MLVSMRLLLVAAGFSSAAAMRSLLHANLANGEPEKTAVSDDTAAPRQVRIQFIRHAYSCANMVQQFAEGGTLTRWGGKFGKAHLRDPMLSECGAVRSKSAGDTLRSSPAEVPDFVLSSSMLRAMETAAYMFPDSTIIPVPYISENRHFDLERDNLPLDVESQKAQLAKAILSNRTEGIRRPLLQSLVDKLDWQWMTDDKFGAKGSSSPRMSSDWEEFEDFMANVFLPHVDAAETHPHPKVLTIAIVSHSNFLKGIPDVKKHCSQFYSDKPENNQVLELRFEQVPSGPPRETDGIKMKVKRKLDAVADQECINHITVDPKLEHLCQKDIGSVCIDELAKAFPKDWSRPKLKLHELNPSAEDDCCVK